MSSASSRTTRTSWARPSRFIAVITCALLIMAGQALVSPSSSTDAHAATPPLAVKVQPAGVDQVKVSWTGQQPTSHLAVIAGSEGSLKEHAFDSGVYPASTRSVTLTVPSKYRDVLGTGSGNPIFVKVATFNTKPGGNLLPRDPQPNNRYRLSLAGTYSYAGQGAAEGDTLRVAEWNMHSIDNSKETTGYAWKDRRDKIVNGVKYANPDLLAAVELTTAYVKGEGKTRQWEDLAKRLKPAGYEVAYEPGPAEEYGSNVTRATHLFYKPSVLKVLDSGDFALDSLPISWPKGLLVRTTSWAKFEVRATGETFFAVSAHLPPNSGGHDYSKLRADAAKAIDAMISKKAGMDTVIFAGDFNSSFITSKSGPAQALRSLGYYDTAAAPKRSNPKTSTANQTNQRDNKGAPGYPYTPYEYKYPAPRIDYIMVKNSAGAKQYTNQIVRSGNKFDPKYQGSDHNLQWADVVIRSVPQVWLPCTSLCGS